MWPRSHLGEQQYRAKMRKKEASLIWFIFQQDFFNLLPSPCRILEFGCGDGYQAEIFRDVDAQLYLSDIQISPKLSRDISSFNQHFYLTQSDIRQSPYPSNFFDIIFSNHAMEHVGNFPRACSELQRIGKASCLYLIALPTATYMLSSVPALYYNKLRKIYGVTLRKILSRLSRDQRQDDSEFAIPAKKFRQMFDQGWWSFLLQAALPGGHGDYQPFWSAFSSFRIDSWRKNFKKAGFHIEDVHSLYLYAPAEWPIVPMSCWPARKFGLASTVLFVLWKE